MVNIMMALSDILFIIVFSFLSFIFLIVIISKFKNKTYKEIHPNISIIIPSFNEEKNIQACLNSIQNLNYDKNKIETILVDDGSTDDTIKLAKKYKIKIIKQNHLGKTQAVNNGISKAKHEFILTLDADTRVHRDMMKEIIKPFSDEKVAATTGILKVRNKKNIITRFQSIEYDFFSLIRDSFSKTFDNNVWFLGALACYRKSVLKKIGLFKTDTLTEDIDIAMEIRKAEYKNISAPKAIGYTIAPSTIKELYQQRSRWWIGGLQSIFKHKNMFSPKYGIPIMFLFVNQLLWSVYAIVSIPIIIYQVNFWLPYNSNSFIQLFTYLFRWFSLLGPIHVWYKLPSTGFSTFTFFSVSTGTVSAIMLLIAIKEFKSRFNFKNLLAVFFFFPYTIVLNIIILISLIKMRFLKTTFFKK